MPLHFKAKSCQSTTDIGCVTAEGKLLPNGTILPIGTWPALANCNPIVPPGGSPVMMAAVEVVASVERKQRSVRTNLPRRRQHRRGSYFADTDWVLDIAPKVMGPDAFPPGSPVAKQFKSITFWATSDVDTDHMQDRFQGACSDVDSYNFFYGPGGTQGTLSKNACDFMLVPGEDMSRNAEMCYPVHFRRN